MKDSVLYVDTTKSQTVKITINGHQSLRPQVQTAESEAKIVSQYSDLLKEAKQQFQREVSSLTPEIQANWKGLSKNTQCSRIVTTNESGIECTKSCNVKPLCE